MKKKILVCDDDDDILEVLTIILENGGYDVLPVHTGKEVKHNIEEYHPDLLLLDVMMPETSGKDITIELKKDKKMKTPIILISAVTNFEQIAREAGADDFVVKPFDMKTLLSKVGKQLSHN